MAEKRGSPDSDGGELDHQRHGQRPSKTQMRGERTMEIERVDVACARGFNTMGASMLRVTAAAWPMMMQELGKCDYKVEVDAMRSRGGRILEKGGERIVENDLNGVLTESIVFETSDEASEEGGGYEK